MTPEQIEGAKLLWKRVTRDRIMTAAQEAYLIGYDLGARHIARRDTTSQARRDLDCSEGAQKIALMITDVLTKSIQDLPRPS